MDIQDLIGIGRLGGRDDSGYYHLMLKPGFKSVLSELTDFYLIFSSDRVFYVTINDLKRVDKKVFVRFTESGIDEERHLHKEVILAIDDIPDEEADEQNEKTEMDNLLGFTVVHEEQNLGVIQDYFDNGAQYVLVIKTLENKEVMVPYVDYFVSAVVSEMNTIFLQNAIDLIEQ